METSRKHSAQALPPPRAAGLAKPLDDLAHRFWSGRPLSMTPPPPARAACGELEVDRIARRATLAGGELRLTPREYALLLCLVDRANRVVRRSDLLAAIWSLPDDYGSNVVDVYIRRLREKFGAHAGMIRTIRGFGYCLRHTG
jgi:DNA-binding response OmpR family regulator